MKTQNTKSSKAKNGCLGGIIVLVILGIVFYNLLTPEASNFEQAGYFKQENFRVYTYNIKASIERNNLSDSLINEMKQQAIADMQTKGKQTQVFFYENTAPDITLAGSYNKAIETCYAKKPVFVVIKDNNGKNYFEINP